MTYSKTSLSVLFLSFFFVINAQQLFPCYYIFGDSVFDNGNNNVLATTAKVNYSPYGIDFPSGPTGRFSNGKNLPDFIAENLGFTGFIPPVTTATQSDFERGVNYASGGAGILRQSGRNLGARISFGDQIIKHQSTVFRVPDKAKLKKCLYTVGIGSNDYINNYFMPNAYLTSLLFTPDRFASYLMQRLCTLLKILHVQGARKVAVFGIGQIGCTPRLISLLGADASGCVDRANSAVLIFNAKLIDLVQRLNVELTNATFTYIDSYGGGVQSLVALGFTNLTGSCCIVNSGQELCAPGQIPCANRESYIFWDKVHVTQALSRFGALGAVFGEAPSVNPYNISRLARL